MHLTFHELVLEIGVVKMRGTVSTNFLWENRPSEEFLLSFDGLIDISLAFIEGKNRWPGIEEGHSVHLRSVECGNQVVQQRMDLRRSKGAWYRITCLDFWTFDGGFIAGWNDYFDLARVQAFKAAL